MVAVDSEGDIVGCGQIKVHRDGSHELASIAVVPAWRGGGVARRIIESLNAAHPETLFLTCRERLGPFYKKFGFMIVDDREMTPYFQRIWRISHWLSALGLVHDDLLVMKRPGTTPHS